MDGLKFVLLDNYFLDIFTEVQIWYWKLSKFCLGPKGKGNYRQIMTAVNN